MIPDIIIRLRHRIAVLALRAIQAEEGAEVEYGEGQCSDEFGQCKQKVESSLGARRDDIWRMSNNDKLVNGVDQEHASHKDNKSHGIEG